MSVIESPWNSTRVLGRNAGMSTGASARQTAATIPSATAPIAMTDFMPRSRRIDSRSPRNTRSDVADPPALRQRRQRLVRRNEFLAQPAFVSGGDDRLDHRRVIKLLGVVDLMPARNPAGVVVGEGIFVLPDGGDDVAFHDLHVVD